MSLDVTCTGKNTIYCPAVTKEKPWSTVCYCCSVVQWCLTLCDPMDCRTPGFPLLHHLPKLAQRMSIESVMPFNHPVFCCPLLLPSIFPSIRVFSNELFLRIRWSKYWSFSFSISPSSEYSRLISFRIDRFDLLCSIIVNNPYVYMQFRLWETSYCVPFPL